MKIFVKVAAMLAAFLFSGAAMPQSSPPHDGTGWYVGGEIAFGQADVSTRGLLQLSADADDEIVFGIIAGYRINRYLDVEARLSSVTDVCSRVTYGRTVEACADAIGLAVVVKGRYPFDAGSTIVAPYLAVGYSGTWVDVDASWTTTEWDSVRAVGVEVELPSRLSIRVEYSSESEDVPFRISPGVITTDLNVLSVGTVRRF